MTIRDNIPIEQILRVYMDETDEQNVQVIQEEVISEKPNNTELSNNNQSSTQLSNDSNENNNDSSDISDNLKTFIEKESDNITIEIDDKKEDKSLENKFDTSTDLDNKTNKLNFSDIDTAITEKGVIENIEAPKTIERLNQISIENAEKRKLDKDDDDEDETIEFGEDANIEIDDLDIDKIEL